MQKLEERHNNTPTDAPQVRSNCDSDIKHYCGVGKVYQNLKTSSNNSEVDQQSDKTEQDLRVPVLNMRGNPLMPTTPAKARHLLEQNKATVVTRKPFTIQLSYVTGETKQPITLGIDSGYSEVGFSAITDKKELLSGKLSLLKNMKKCLEDRSVCRKQRRSRLWHRKPRFDNRAKPKDWIAPSLQNKLDTHIRLIEKLKKLLPITKIIVEVASFDIQKMINPEIKGIEYRQGTLLGYTVRQYLLQKWNHKCVYCGKTNVPLEVEHMIPLSKNGTNRVINLTISCKPCNKKKGNKTVEEFGYPELREQADKAYKDATFMNIIRWKLVNLLNCEHTYGSVTKHSRIKLDLEKSHTNDAFVIAGGTTQERTIPFDVLQVRRNNRCLEIFYDAKYIDSRNGKKVKGSDLNNGRHSRNKNLNTENLHKYRKEKVSKGRRNIRRKRYSLQPKDLIDYEGKKCYVTGASSYGRYVQFKYKNGKFGETSPNKVKLIKYGKGLCFI